VFELAADEQAIVDVVAEFDVERYFRDAPLMIVGEGTNEIQRNVIARQLIARDR
jgi:alkylation response protein AidB-like acyl-CoA dehydrogenase